MTSERFGQYLLIRPLAQGRSKVYEAEDTATRHRVALKMFPRRDPRDLSFKRLREADIAARMLEPMTERRVVLFRDIGEIDGQSYAQMPLIDAVDLRALLAGGPLTPRRAVAIVGEIAAALDAVQAAGLVHGDIAPKNILVTHDDSAYLLGLQSRTYWGDATTDPGFARRIVYTAPERFTNAEVTYGADIYSLACVLYECLTGAQPFPGDSLEQKVIGHLTEAPPKPSDVNPAVPSTFDEVIARGMAKTPEDRYASAGDLAEAARDALKRAGSGGARPENGWGTPPQQQGRR